MGLFSNIFKSKQPSGQGINTQPTTQSIRFFKDNETNSIIVEYYDSKATAKEFYDTTKLVIDPNPTEVEGVLVNSAKVAWYNEEDACFIDEDGNQSGSRFDFTDIKVEIDMDRLFEDPTYQRVLMTQLLDKKRVEYKYIPMGMEEKPSSPCGNYVGAVSKTYGRQFDAKVGQAIHNSPEMVEKRQRYFERKEKARQEGIAIRQEEIKKLQSEIDELNN